MGRRTQTRSAAVTRYASFAPRGERRHSGVVPRDLRQERIAELLQARFEEIRHTTRFGQTPVGQALGEQGGQFQILGEALDDQRLRWRDGPVKFHSLQFQAPIRVDSGRVSLSLSLIGPTFSRRALFPPRNNHGKDDGRQDDRSHHRQ